MSVEYANIADDIEALAQNHPDTVAIYYPSKRDQYEQYTYSDLTKISGYIAHGLETVGIQRGTRTVVMVQPSLDFFALVFGMLRAGVVPVIVDPGMGIRNLKTCLAQAEPQAFIGIPKAHIARILFRWANKTLQHHVTVGRRWLWGGHTLDELVALGKSKGDYQTVKTRSDEVAAIPFTSGSTGVPKGVIYTHGNFKAQFEMLRQTYDLKPGEMALPTFPIFALLYVGLGITSVIPKMDFTRPGHVDPQAIIQPIHQFDISDMFGSPALLDRVGRYGNQHGTQLSSLRRVLSAGAPASPPTLEQFSGTLSESGLIHTGYGATECLPVASINHPEILHETAQQTDQGAGVCVGRPVEGMQVKIIGITDDPIATWDDDLCLPQGEIGEIVVQGANASPAYYNRPDKTALAKISDPQTGGFFHRMGDVGYFDDQKRLWFCGRKSHRVITQTETLFTIPCERVFDTHPDVKRTALVGVDKQAVLCVELEPHVHNRKRNRIRMELLEIGNRYNHTASIKTVVFHASFPVDIRHNSKIFREKLALWAHKKV